MRILSLGLALLTVGLSACQAKQTHVIIETDYGPIEMLVHEDKAPLSAKDFLYYVDNGLYDRQGFYRVVRDDNDPLKMGMSLVQGGRLDLERYTAEVPHESTQMSGLSNGPGSVALARNAPGTASAAYFFINIGNNDFLDHGGTRNPDGEGYAVFAEVISGMDVVGRIQTGATNETDQMFSPYQRLTAPVTIKRAYRKD